MLSSARHVSSSLIGVACVIGMSAFCVPALGQEPVPTVIGHPDAVHGRILTADVSYGDLDLTTGYGRGQLQHRVHKTAERLCSRAGEDHIGGASMALSCEDQTLLDTAGQQRDAIARAMAAAASPDNPALAAADGSPAAGRQVLTVSVAGIR
jgi:UrcA family protein